MHAVGKLTWVELRLFAREPLSLIFTFAFPLVVLFTLSGSFEPGDAAFGGVDPTDYYMASYIAVVIAAMGLIALPVHIAGYRERGVMRRFRASAVPAGTVFAAQAIVSVVLAALGSLVLVIAGWLVLGAALPTSPGRTVAAFLLGTLAFLAVGVLLGLVTGGARAAQALGLVLFFPMWLLCGAGPPPAVMGDGMRHVSEALPLTYVVNAVKDPWLGASSNVLDLTVLAALLVAATLAALRLLRRT